MKQSAAKTLGVAALGVAFAAAGAGAANAAPGVPGAPDPSQALGTVSQALPLDNVSQTLPGATGTVDQGQRALGAGLEAAHPAVAEGPAAPVGGLLGGIPVGQTLPTEGLGANGLPLGGPTA
ncbi:ATP-binding protein [Streptomyces tailanensis]|uniref:ATP-binding protein n=1 Tax=Streptomyces tailanensis TaxID=2569858 RepID=UPI00122E096E|nr:ATP-binding protein [Streptomyces tailanensis]